MKAKDWAEPDMVSIHRPIVIDSHCHAGKGDGLTGPWDTAAPLEKYLRRAARAGIARIVLFAAFHSDYAVANREVRAHRRHPPEQVLWLCLRASGARPGPGGGHGAGGSGATRLRRPQGAPPRRPHHREVCEAAAAYALPVNYDVMGEVSVVELLASEYPGVSFIIPHLGSFADDWKAQIAFIDQLARHPNVYTDTSGVRRFDLLEEAVRRAGAHKILFGSDGPWLHPGIELAKVRALGLPPADEARILGGNFLQLIAPVRRSRQGPAVHIGQRWGGLPVATRDPWVLEQELPE